MPKDVCKRDGMCKKQATLHLLLERIKECNLYVGKIMHAMLLLHLALINVQCGPSRQSV